MVDEDDGAAWIDYVIASDAPGDKELSDAFIARNWAYAQTLQWVMRETAAGRGTQQTMDRLAEEAALCDALQERIHRRGQELRASGARPLDLVSAEAWHAQWRNISPTLPVDDDGAARA